MRGYLGWVVGGLVLALGSTASAQVSFGGFGGYPSGFTTGSGYGYLPGTSPQPFMGVPGGPGSYVATRNSTYYSSGYYGGVPSTAILGATVNYLAPASAYYGYGSMGYAPVYPTVGYAPVYPTYGSYYVPRSSFYGGGFLGRGRFFGW